MRAKYLKIYIIVPKIIKINLQWVKKIKNKTLKR